MYLVYRGLRDRRYFQNLGQRFGFLPESASQATLRTTASGSIWLHAVSVGEVLSAIELIRRLRMDIPDLDVFVSTTTLAGKITADQRLIPMGARVFYAPFPLDYKSIIRRVLRQLKPSAVIVMETEIWPNFYREARRAGASLIVVNGRLSDRSFPRYVPWRWFLQHVLELPNKILVQSQVDAARYIQIGAPPENVQTLGNLKYDFKPPAEGPPEIATFIDQAGPTEVWVVASTMPGVDAQDVDEDDIVITAFQSLRAGHPGLMLILAPRRPDRFDLVAGKLAAAKIPFVRRSQIAADSRCQLPGVLLLDTIGELASLFQRADVVFMGGTMARRGGHNILEPAYFGKPVIVGPHMENFAEIANEFLAGGGLLRIAATAGLAGAVDALLADPQRRIELGVRAQSLAVAKRGVVERVVVIVKEAIDQGIPQPMPVLWKRVVLSPLTWVWALGHKINMQRGAQRSLTTRVISIGGLSMGGVGKSPVVAHLAERLNARGLTPAILTRGYRRESKSIVIVPKGGTATVQQTGDEAQTFVRQGVAHLGIGVNRFEVGQRLERELKPDLFLLDDGFQHFGLNRDQDIVLIDAQDPFAGGLFPLGLRREPLSGLSRATAIVITRAERGTSGLEALIHRYNSRAPIYRSYMVVTAWKNEPDGKKVAAFCGIGSPSSFWRTLQQAGFTLVTTRAFRDHHKYTPDDLRQVAQEAKTNGAEALVTTEKDMMNLCDGAAELVAPLKICCLKIGVEIENEDDLLRQIVGKPS